MATLIDKAGNRYSYTTIDEHGDSVTLDGGRIIAGRLSDFTNETGVYPTVGAIAFQRLFHIDERVKARELRVNDPKLDDIWRQLEDPRTDVVVMALPSVQADIEYTLQAVKAAGLTLDVEARKAQILSGKLQ